MFRFMICDDEQYYVNEIKQRIEKRLEKEDVNVQIDTCLSGAELCKDMVELNSYDVIFLDVVLGKGEMNGIELGKKIKERNDNIIIVYISAYVDYATLGYLAQAIRFLFKDKLDQTLSECLNAVLKKLRWQNQEIEYGFLEGRRKLLVGEICYVESSGHKLRFHRTLENLSVLSLYSKLDDIEEGLVKHGFIRIHKSYLVNIRSIVKVKNYSATLVTGTSLPIPKKKYHEIRELYFEMKGGW